MTPILWTGSIEECIDWGAGSVLRCGRHSSSLVLVARPSDTRCTLPPRLRDEISRKYPGASIGNVTDPDEYDQKLFQKDRGARCAVRRPCAG